MSEEDKQEQIKTVKRFIKTRYPNANVDNLKIGFSRKNPMDLVVKGPRGGETKIVLADGSDFQKSFISTSFIRKELGPPAESIIQKTGEYIKEKQKELQALRDSEKFLRGKKEDVENLKERLNKERATVEQLGQGPDNEEEIKRRERLMKNLEEDLKIKQKEVRVMEQQTTQEKIGQLKTSISEEEMKRNAMEEKLYSTKDFDALKEQKIYLQRQNEEDQAIIQDDMAPSFDKEAAEERVAARNEELARLQTQIAERQAAMPLRERVREIFKKYGVTVASIFLAAGITIGAVIGTITNALKSMGNQLANGLKTVGAKAAAALPGLIGAIVSFLFKTAGRAIGFLANHTWLLILAAVAFIFEKYIKRRG